jgi:hypothetical protein
VEASSSVPLKMQSLSSKQMTLMQVYVNDYRMVGIGARIFLGVMTGNAYIDAQVDAIASKVFAELGTATPK